MPSDIAIIRTLEATTYLRPNLVDNTLDDIGLEDKPSLVQLPGDFPSTGTSESTESTFDSAGYEDVDWTRVLGYQPPTKASKQGRSSWIYSWGWRIIKKSNHDAYWLYRLCHNASKSVRPNSYIYKANATNRAIYHLKLVH